MTSKAEFTNSKLENSKGALFDFDHTLVTCCFSCAFGRFLYKKGLVSSVSAISFLFFYGLYFCCLLSLKKLHQVAFYLFFYHKKADKYKELVDVFLQSELHSLLRPSMVEELERQKKEGTPCLLASSSPDFLVGPFAKKMGFDQFLATKYEIDSDGYFAKIGQVADAKNKLKWVQERSNLEQVVAYTDSIHDLALLQAVGHPVVVNPSHALKKIAQKRAWQIMEDRA